MVSRWKSIDRAIHLRAWFGDDVKTWNMNTKLWILIIGLGFLAGFSNLPADTPTASRLLEAYSRELAEEFPDVPTVSTAELADMRPPPVLLDVRASAEFEVSRIEGALQAEENPVELLQARGVGHDQPIVVYCSVGYRSALAVRQLREGGFKKARNLQGSIFAWANEDRPVVDAEGPASGVHPYNRRWGRFLERSKWQWSPK